MSAAGKRTPGWLWAAACGASRSKQRPRGSGRPRCFSRSSGTHVNRGRIRRRRVWRSAVLLLAFWLVGSLPSARTARPQDRDVIDTRREYNVKGAFLYSFGRYVTWPASAFPSRDAPFVIGVLGEAPIDRVLQRIQETKTVQGRRIAVRHYESMDEYRRCHILFIAGSVESEEREQALRRLEEDPVLIVGETSKFAEAGGVVGFYIAGDSVRFKINVRSMRRKGLSVDAKLLRVAKIVE